MLTNVKIDGLLVKPVVADAADSSSSSSSAFSSASTGRLHRAVGVRLKTDNYEMIISQVGNYTLCVMQKPPVEEVAEEGEAAAAE